MAEKSKSRQSQATKKKGVNSDLACITEVIKQNDLLVHKGGCLPSVPPRDEWVGDIFSKDTFWDKGKKPKLDVTSQTDDKLWFIKLEPHADSKEEIKGNSMLHFRNKWKKLLLSTTQFPLSKELSPEWVAWVNYIIANPKYMDLLKQVRVFNAIVAFTRLQRINTSKVEVWQSLLSQWSIQTHTLITIWGGIGQTLDDVIMLYQSLG